MGIGGLPRRRAQMPHRIVALPCAVGEDRVHGLLERAIGAANGPARQWLPADYFPPRPKGRFASRSKIAGLPPSSALLRPVASLPGAGPNRPPPFVAMKAAMSAVDPTKGSAP